MIYPFSVSFFIFHVANKIGFFSFMTLYPLFFPLSCYRLIAGPFFI